MTRPSVIYYEAKPRVVLQGFTDGDAPPTYEPIIPRREPDVALTISIRLSERCSHPGGPYHSDQSVGVVQAIREELMAQGHRFVSHEITAQGVVTKAWRQ